MFETILLILAVIGLSALAGALFFAMVDHLNHGNLWGYIFTSHALNAVLDLLVAVLKALKALSGGSGGSGE